MTAKLLSPFSCLYLMGHRLKQSLSGNPYKSTIPVICIGGVVAGGSGKTPTLHALLSLIRRDNLFQNPVVLTRGYGGNIKAATCVNLTKHTAIDVGDEALLHAKKALTIVARDRSEGANLAERINADIILMDDGLQNNSLKKTASVLVVNAHQKWGNGKLLPAGPLREPVEDALAKAALIVLIGKGHINSPKPQTNAHITSLKDIDSTRGYHAFAGIGDPKKFRQTLIEAGAQLTGFTAFSDHHIYTMKDMEILRSSAGSSTLITTEKDFIRIPQDHRHAIETLPIEIIFENEDTVLSLLKGIRE